MAGLLRLMRLPFYGLSSPSAVSIMQLITDSPSFPPLFGRITPFEDRKFSVLIFLPNLASPFARESAKMLNSWISPLDEWDAQLICITMTPADLARDAVPRLLLKYPIVCDPEGHHFQNFDIHPAPLLGCIPRRIPTGILRSVLEWRQAFRARGGHAICQNKRVVHQASWTRIDSHPELNPILNILRQISEGL